MTAVVECLVCGKSLVERRAGTKTCKGQCRTAAWRARRAMRDGDTGKESRRAAVTVSEPLVTLTGLPGDPCPDPTHCAYRWRHASGPWTCAHNHPARRAG
jgi:hypothetical protein